MVRVDCKRCWVKVVVLRDPGVTLCGWVAGDVRIQHLTD